MPSQSNGWNKFVKRITIKADPQTIYNAWSTQAAIESWFLRQSLFYTNNEQRNVSAPIQSGDNYIWRWYGYADDVTENGKIIAANETDMLQFTFTGDCLVTFKTYVENRESVAELTQENIPEDNNPSTNLYVGCGEGWTFYLANLKSILEGGIDLRNRNVNIKRVINS